MYTMISSLLPHPLHSFSFQLPKALGDLTSTKVAINLHYSNVSFSLYSRFARNTLYRDLWVGPDPIKTQLDF